MKCTFTPSITVVDKINGTESIDSIHDETMLFSCSVKFARDNGGVLTNKALDLIIPHLKEIDGRYWVVDTRSHMLMPGQFPAIGGFHGDGVIRSDYNSQPDLNKMDNSEHYAMTLSTHPDGVSNTEFISEELEFDNIDIDYVWGSISKQVGDAGKRFIAPDGHLIRFTSPTLHRARPTERRGWRWFIRCSSFYAPPQNKIRKQVQVYTDIEGGW